MLHIGLTTLSPVTMLSVMVLSIAALGVVYIIVCRGGCHHGVPRRVSVRTFQPLTLVFELGGLMGGVIILWAFKNQSL